MSLTIIQYNMKELFSLHVLCSLTDKTLLQSCPAGLCWGISAQLPSGTRAWPFCFETAEAMERWGKEGMKLWKWRREWKEECVSVTICCLYKAPRAQSRFTRLSFQRHASWSSLLENLLTSPHTRWHHTAVCSSASGNMSGLKPCH